MSRMKCYSISDFGFVPDIIWLQFNSVTCPIFRKLERFWTRNRLRYAAISADVRCYNTHIIHLFDFPGKM